MARAGEPLVLRCFAEHVGEQWNALCIDLDISAQGETLAEVKALLEDMIDTYIESAVAASPQVRYAMLSRKAPWSVRLGYLLSFFGAYLFAARGSNDRMDLILHRAFPA